MSNDKLDDLERQCIEQIEAIMERARREAEPFAKHLANIRAMRPRTYFVQDGEYLRTIVPLEKP